jgi:hypothetical protein
MAKEEVEVEVSGNPNNIEWPTDRMGVTSDLRKAGMSTAGRVNGQLDKLKLTLATLDILRKHTKARYAAQVAENQLVRSRGADRTAEEERRAEKQRQYAVEQAKQELARLEAAAPAGTQVELAV